jgi:hypothetical protein
MGARSILDGHWIKSIKCRRRGNVKPKAFHGDSLQTELHRDRFDQRFYMNRP